MLILTDLSLFVTRANDFKTYLFHCFNIRKTTIKQIQRTKKTT